MPGDQGNVVLPVEAYGMVLSEQVMGGWVGIYLEL